MWTKTLALLTILATLPGEALSDTTMGKTLFQIHCAMCHGATATGNGRIAGVLTIPPPDLTMLARSYEGFPTDYVVRRIDGSERLKSHGDPMPVYTLLFEGPMEVLETPTGAEIAAPEAIADIVAWLESIQR